MAVGGSGDGARVRIGVSEAVVWIVGGATDGTVARGVAAGVVDWGMAVGNEVGEADGMAVGVAQLESKHSVMSTAAMPQSFARVIVPSGSTVVAKICAFRSAFMC